MWVRGRRLPGSDRPAGAVTCNVRPADGTSGAFGRVREVARLPWNQAGGEMTHVVNVHEASTQLSKLLARVEAGEDVVIARRGEPVARLVACRPPSRRQADVLKGRITIPDSFFDPLPAEELVAWDDR